MSVVGVLFALLTLGLSVGPGWRELRSFALCAGLGALFSVSNVLVTLHPPAAVTLLLSHASIAVAGLHGSAWFAYSARQDDRRLVGWERVLVGGALVLSVVALIPGVLVGDHVRSRAVPALGVVYRDGEPTGLGVVCFAYFTGALVILIARYARKWRAGERGAASHVVGLSALTLGGLLDSLAMEGFSPLPYLLDFGFLILVVAVGSSLVSRFVRAARALEDSSRQLSDTQAELVRRERLAALGEMAAVVAHEVRNPVGVIFNAIASLKRLPPSSAGAGDLLHIVEEEAERLKHMVSELLEFARPRALRLRAASLESLLAGAVEAAQYGNHDPEVEGVQMSVEGESPAIVCDEQLVRQAVINLVTNALEAPHRRSPVRVCAKAEGAQVEIAVIDDGDGVPREIADRIFVPFFTTRPTGTGLGLPLVQRIAEAHGGTVGLRATRGGGATFVLCLPVRTRA